MLVRESVNNDIKHDIIRSSKGREYEVNLTNGDDYHLHTFSYTEPPFIEYSFDNNSFAVSGSEQHGLYGVIRDGNYYYKHFAKEAASFRQQGPFWNNFSGSFNLNLENKKKYSFNTEVNLWFNTQLYWHWFCEDIPIIDGFRRNKNPIVINKLTEWQKESIRYFPDIIGRIVEVETPCIIYSDVGIKTYTYPAISFRGKSSQWAINFLKENLYEQSIDKPNQRIYISRGDAIARVVENESEVKNYLQNRGFTCYDNFSDLTLSQKLKIFTQASIVVSPTGAGLTHCHAMAEGSTVIDFNHSFELTEECGWNSIGTHLNWYTFPATTASDNDRSKMGGVKIKNRNLIVDLNILDKVLSNEINKKL
jgi:hypothetical protein